MRVASDYIHVVCGYRSPQTNSMLRSRSKGVAKKSQHMLGKAMDFYIPGVKLKRLREIGLKMQGGGVGYYPSLRIALRAFRRRQCPPLAQDEPQRACRAVPRWKDAARAVRRQAAARLQPGARLLPGAQEERQCRGRAALFQEFQQSTRSGGFLAAFFGGGGGADDEEDSSTVTLASVDDASDRAPQTRVVRTAKRRPRSTASRLRPTAGRPRPRARRSSPTTRSASCRPNSPIPSTCRPSRSPKRSWPRCRRAMCRFRSPRRARRSTSALPTRSPRPASTRRPCRPGPLRRPPKSCCLVKRRPPSRRLPSIFRFRCAGPAMRVARSREWPTRSEAVIVAAATEDVALRFGPAGAIAHDASRWCGG